jgi:hypothetical protein
MTPREILQMLEGKGYRVPAEVWQLKDEDIVLFCDEANRWLRRIKHLHVHVGIESGAKTFPMWTWRVDIVDPAQTEKRDVHEWQVWLVDHWHPNSNTDDTEPSWPTYEEAMWDGIESCLSEI